MIILPAIDLINGEVVRLTKGDYATAEVFSDNPTKIKEQFIKCGAKALHVVDLDGAKSGLNTNFSTIRSLCEGGGLAVEVGGGIRSVKRVEEYLQVGAQRVILGTGAVKDEDFLKEALSNYGEKIAVGVDASDGKVAIDGWRTVTDVDSVEFCKKCIALGAKTIIYTDIATDGNMQGTNLKIMKKLKELDVNLIASGGISSLDEIKALRDMNIYGAIVGKALYKGLFTLEDAIRTAR